jgi:glycerol-3-phosphate dehydrogenase (NAD(P)+)
MTERIAILGAGSWGTALAHHCARIGHDVRLWGRDEPLVREIAATRVNARYLPSATLPERVLVSAALDDTLLEATLVIAALPSHGFRAVMRSAVPWIAEHAVIVSATKGLESGSLARMTQVVSAEAGAHRTVVALSGPSFAEEVAHGLPTAVVAASTDAAAAARVQAALKGSSFRLYASADVAGVEFGGAFKNVIAIAAGVVDGLALGHNAMAALITRGLVEMSRLACAEGGRRDTMSGLSGLGDLVLTCTGDLSRNRRLGIELGRGRTLEDVLSKTRMVAEGIRTTHAALALGQRHGIELPIAAQMAAVLDRIVSPREAVDMLMLRRQRAEVDN